MALKQTIQDNIKEALKSREQVVLGTLRMFLAAISVKEKEKKYKEKLEDEAQLTEEEILNVLSSEIKKRRDAIVLYNQGNRPELAKKEEEEIKVLQKYLPEQLTEQELKFLVKQAIEKTQAKEMKDMGRVMAELNPKIKGKAEGSQVSKIVKELLEK